MRKFDYIKDYNKINIEVKKYFLQFEEDLKLIISREENNEVFIKAYKVLEEFKNKYSDMYNIYNQILNDLLSSENVEYCYKNGKYKIDASLLGLEFEKDLNNIYILEEYLKEYIIRIWKRDLTSFDNIENGKDFMAVVHASYLLPGVKGDPNYKNNSFSKLYLSCSLLTSLDLNTFNDIKALYVIGVDEDNYISSSYEDCVTRDSNNQSINTVGEIDIDGEKHYIEIGYSGLDRSSNVLAVPKMIEELSVQRELQGTKELYRYNTLTNEVVLDRTKSKRIGGILLSNGCDILLSEYINFKQNNVKFKCINKGLYRQKNNIVPYTEEEYNNFIIELDNVDNIISKYNISLEVIEGYYNEVIIPMKYDSVVMREINRRFSKYLPNIYLEKNR